MLKMTWDQAARWRARRHHLDRRAPAGKLLAVAGRLCGFHAQVLSCAELTAWARVEGLQRGKVQKALWEDRTLVKTWAMRGTLHLLPSAELPMWHAGLSTSRRYVTPVRWQKYAGITLDELDALTVAVGEVLHDRVLTREGLARELARTGSPELAAKVAASSWGMMLKPAAFTGRLCFGPSAGTRVQFTNPRSWLGIASGVEPAAATAEITRRYLAAYGPATARDLSRWWNGGGVGLGREWLAALGDEAVQVDIEGTPAWMLAADARRVRDLDPPRAIRLLPGFDQYVVGASWHVEELLPGAFRGRIFRPQGWISPVLLVDGRMLGVWRHEIKGSRVDVTIEPFIRVPAWVRRGAAEEAERLAEFLGGKVQLSWGPSAP
jgi:Winged helix DNA-binding domain